MNSSKQINQTIVRATVFCTCMLATRFITAQVGLVDVHTTMEDGNNNMTVDLVFSIEDSMYVQSNTPSNKYFIPTVFKLGDCHGLNVTEIAYLDEQSQPEEDKILGLSVYRDSFRVRIQAMPTAGPVTISGTLDFQACDKKRCFFPTTYPVDVSVPIEQAVVSN